MMRPQRKKRTSKGRENEFTPKESELGVRQDLPEESSIIGEKEFTLPKGNKYRIVLTDETDAYDEPTPTSKKRKDNERK